MRNDWKQKFFDEFSEYWVNVAYLSLFFTIFTLDRRLILAHHGIFSDDYFFQIIKALVFAKVIMIGGFLRIDRGLENKPLIFPVLYKSVLFTAWIAAFDFSEVFVRALMHAPDVTTAYRELLESLTYLKLGGTLVVLFAFMPFFAFKELSREIGREKLIHLFFKKRTD